MSNDRFLSECLSLDWRALFQLFANLLREDTKQLDLPARALREKARAGEMPEEAIPTLSACLMAAEDHQVIADLAKALAAFGRAANVAAPVLQEKIQEMMILDDVSFWAFDGCMHAMGYIGSSEQKEFIDDIFEKVPVIKSGDLYRGQISQRDRGDLFCESIERVRELMAAEDPGVWRKKRTSWTASQGEEKKKLSAWMIR